MTAVTCKIGGAFETLHIAVISAAVFQYSIEPAVIYLGGIMKLKAGDIVTIKHYSGISAAKYIVLDMTEDTIKIKLSREFAQLSLLEDDPVVLGFEREDTVNIFGCNVIAVDPSEGVVELKADRPDTGADSREHERYPVSLYADIRLRDTRKKQLAIIKDISLYGVLAYSKSDITPGDAVDLEIFTDKSVMFVSANTVRKTQLQKYKVYGMNIIYPDQTSINTMRDYIKKLRQEQEEQIRRIR